jgi:F0F1-type ATP synthase alpha subunit
VDEITSWEARFHKFMEAYHPEVEQKINTEKEMKPETEEALKAAILEFKKSITK